MLFQQYTTIFPKLQLLAVSASPSGDEPLPETKPEELCVEFVVSEREVEGKIIARAVEVIQNVWLFLI